ncbi:hypothetical protein DHOM_01330 [Dermabacter hominis 1368]|uniref:Uncharacterized protein n=1 Tax=Dermabacter hominis 1368 TaxID=1450519 RepID=A0ABR4SMT7_9MICO|nr:hypothetical protein DHOM_01330 [Dermabacter hominis 1368]
MNLIARITRGPGAAAHRLDGSDMLDQAPE